MIFLGVAAALPSGASSPWAPCHKRLARRGKRFPCQSLAEFPISARQSNLMAFPSREVGRLSLCCCFQPPLLRSLLFTCQLVALLTVPCFSVAWAFVCVLWDLVGTQWQRVCFACSEDPSFSLHHVQVKVLSPSRCSPPQESFSILFAQWVLDVLCACISRPLVKPQEGKKIKGISREFLKHRFCLT